MIINPLMLYISFTLARKQTEPTRKKIKTTKKKGQTVYKSFDFDYKMVAIFTDKSNRTVIVRDIKKIN
jgi:hypothetical protein